MDKVEPDAARNSNPVKLEKQCGSRAIQKRNLQGGTVIGRQHSQLSILPSPLFAGGHLPQRDALQTMES
jgi:hypothetical protein